jgi:hypothetical protein
MGRSLPEHLKGDYVKIFTRYTDKAYESCDVKETMSKMREYARIFDKITVSFGLRLFPATAYKDLISKYKNTTDNVVFLKELRGSKTWSVENNKLKFDNVRISDSGVFILQSRDILEAKTDNFNGFLHDLIDQGKLNYKFIEYWVLTNANKKEEHNHRGSR